jgi:hypothetical protein
LHGLVVVTPVWTIVNPLVLNSVLERSVATATQTVPTYDLMMAAAAIAVWATVLALLAAYIRNRERVAARSHIRSIRIARRDGIGSNAPRGVTLTPPAGRAFA